MKLILYVTILFFVNSPLIFTQDTTYTPNLLSTQYYDWGGTDFIFGMSPNNPDIVLSGITDAGALIMKTDDQGNILWTWTGDQGSFMGEISALPNSSYVFLYTTYQNGTNGKIANMSQEGFLLWEKNIGLANSNHISVDTNSEHIASLDYSNIVKILDYSGNQIDSFSLNDNSQLYNHISLSENTIFVSGLGSGGINWSGNSFISKYQKNNGNWQKMWQHTTLDGNRTSFSIDELGYIYLGTTFFYTNYSSFIAQKLDQDGNLIWSQERILTNQYLGGAIHSVILLPDNKGILLMGRVFSNSNTYNGAILAFDLEGNFLFEKTNPSGSMMQYRRGKFDQTKRLVLTGEKVIDMTTGTRDIFLQFWSIDGITAVEPLPVPQPTDFILSQNFPNPFNPTTTIQFSLPQAENIQLKVFNLLGQEIETLVDEYVPSGTFTAQFTAKGLPSGIYIYELQAGNKFIERRKLVLLK